MMTYLFHCRACFNRKLFRYIQQNWFGKIWSMQKLPRIHLKV